jgi:hypothetical protein
MLLWPDSADDAKAMLNFFLLEKALYEVEYELSYRPLWVSVPLEGIRDLLEVMFKLSKRQGNSATSMMAPRQPERLVNVSSVANPSASIGRPATM